MKYNPITIIVLYLVIINIIVSVINIADKYKAKHNKWRIPEATLWIIAVLGGSLGSYATMKVIRHKTKHKSFMMGFPILIIFHLITFFILLFKF